MCLDQFRWLRSTPTSMAIQQVEIFLLSKERRRGCLGTGTVMFCDSHSYMRGVAAGAIDIKCDCFHKLVSACIDR